MIYIKDLNVFPVPRSLVSFGFLFIILSTPCYALDHYHRSSWETTTIRSLETDDGLHFHRPVCNSNLPADKSLCESFTSMFGSRRKYGSRIIVPCGKCYIMDIPHDVVTFKDGIDIHGGIVFPENYVITVRATIIVVQGHLDMYATKKPINGIPNVRFEMIGNEEETFQPMEENKLACGTNCLGGKQTIVVAGGKVNIRGIPRDTPTWVSLYDVRESVDGLIRDIVVEVSVKDKWLPGSTVLITSHTHAYEDQQVRIITNVSDYVDTDGSFVQLTLNETIIRPTTMKDDTRFAVEVALLSRNIVFEGIHDDDGENEDERLQGGHFIILRTTNIRQRIEGVEIRNFGQQGVEGRYPIHFHLCRNATGSIVARNSIVDSNQRCLVVHATNNLQIEENVAYNSAGHCYLVEDGVETGNYFVRNLGALTRRPKYAISFGGRNETDLLKPALFWITNPDNHLIGNVAAGSEAAGFWFELFERGPFQDADSVEPRLMPLTEFLDNTAHSNQAGFRTYPTTNNYNPIQRSKVTGFRSYRNRRHGIFFRRDSNILIEDGLLADNGIGITMDQVGDIMVHNTTFIGRSRSFGAVLDSQNMYVNCVEDLVTGVEIHTFKRYRYEPGIIIRNSRFRGYGANETGCKESIPITFDPTDTEGVSDLSTTISKVNVHKDDAAVGEKTAVVDFCAVGLEGVEDVFITDLDESLSPYDDFSERPATLISDMGENDNFMMKFIDSSKCTRVVEGCYCYCEDTCFRTVRLLTDPANTAEYSLKVCNRLTDSECIILSAGAVPGLIGDARRDQRYFVANLPGGTKYEAVFVDDGGRETWPTFVDVQLEDATCAGGFEDDDFHLRQPEVTEDECMELIRNGNAQEASPKSLNPVYWFAREDGDIVVATGEGKKGGNAFDATAAISNPARTQVKILQYLDSRCLQLMHDSTYKLTAKIKVIDDNGEPRLCDRLEERCPYVGIAFESGEFDETVIMQQVDREIDDEGYQHAERLVVLNDAFAEKANLGIHVFVASPYVGSRKYFIDEVSLEHVADYPVEGAGSAPTASLEAESSEARTGGSPHTDEGMSVLAYIRKFFKGGLVGDAQ